LIGSASASPAPRHLPHLGSRPRRRGTTTGPPCAGARHHSRRRVLASLPTSDVHRVAEGRIIAPSRSIGRPSLGPLPAGLPRRESSTRSQECVAAHHHVAARLRPSSPIAPLTKVSSSGIAGFFRAAPWATPAPRSSAVLDHFVAGLQIAPWPIRSRPSRRRSGSRAHVRARRRRDDVGGRVYPTLECIHPVAYAAGLPSLEARRRSGRRWPVTVRRSSAMGAPRDPTRWRRLYRAIIVLPYSCAALTLCASAPAGVAAER